VRVTLTARGRRALEEIHGQKRRSLLKLYAPLTAAERSSYLGVIEKMVREFTGGSDKS
jgi:DNA-binding MarR family transcriptional regulator